MKDLKLLFKFKDNGLGVEGKVTLFIDGSMKVNICCYDGHKYYAKNSVETWTENYGSYYDESSKEFNVRDLVNSLVHDFVEDFNLQEFVNAGETLDYEFDGQAIIDAHYHNWFVLFN